MTRMLIAASADVNAKDGGGFTSLHWCSPGGMEDGGGSKIAVAEALIEGGADVNAVDLAGVTCLRWTVLHALEHSNNDDDGDDDGGSSGNTRDFMAAITIPLVRLLLQHNADPAICPQEHSLKTSPVSKKSEVVNW